MLSKAWELVRYLLARTVYAFYLQVNETKWLDLSPTGSQSLIFWSSVRTESDTSLWMLL